MNRTQITRHMSCRTHTAVVVSALALVAAAFSLRAAAADPLPKLTVQTAPQLVDKRVEIEFTVAEAKFAMRRKLHLLSATSNFRSPENLPVAIREADFARFEQAGLKNLAERFQGKMVRARGTVVHHEGQYLVVVTVPADLELVADAKPAAEAGKIAIIDANGKRSDITLPLDKEFARTSVTLDHEGARQTFTGVSLAALLEKAGVRLGAEARGQDLLRYLIITAHDGYSTVFSVAEVDPYLAQQPALLAESVDGSPLPQNRAPLQAVIPSDKHRRRWVGQIKQIEVHHAEARPTTDGS